MGQLSKPTSLGSAAARVSSLGRTSGRSASVSLSVSVSVSLSVSESESESVSESESASVSVSESESLSASLSESPDVSVQPAGLEFVQPTANAASAKKTTDIPTKRFILASLATGERHNHPSPSAFYFQ
jgi:hypothetical protein